MSIPHQTTKFRSANIFVVVAIVILDLTIKFNVISSYTCTAPCFHDYYYYYYYYYYITEHWSEEMSVQHRAYLPLTVFYSLELLHCVFE